MFLGLIVEPLYVKFGDRFLDIVQKTDRQTGNKKLYPRDCCQYG